MVGASFDDATANAAFRAKAGLPFPLLCDTDRALGVAYGACRDRSAAFANRITVVIDPGGAVARVYERVSPATHPARVLADLAARSTTGA